MLKLPLFLILSTALVKFSYSATRADTETLYSSIFTNYEKDIRPISDQSRAMTVTISFTLIAINSFDEVSGVISVPGMFTLVWTDERLVWDFWTNGYVYYLKVPQTKLWLPKIYLTSPAKSFKSIGDDDYISNVFFDGTVTWTTGGVLQSTCSPDTTYFPFDSQNCTFTVLAFGYGATEIVFNTSKTVDLTYFQVNGEWELVSATGSDYLTSGTEGASFAKFDIEIKRRPLYFVISILLPVIFLAFLNPLVYMLPVDSGERMSFCLTVLLSFAVFMTLVDDVMPKSSEPSMALVSFYILGTIVYSALTTIINVFILAAYHRHEDDNVPKFLQWLVRTFCCKKKPNIINPDISAADDNVTIRRINVATVNEHEKGIGNAKTGVSDMSSGKVIITWKMFAMWIDWTLFIGSYLLVIASTVGFTLRLVRG